ncbi:hypothetical protein BDQ17DRAFT_775439 [Cyathus striatus]|nr:hypothetical protein BDQ17DRAFT_775439 [Cyathus striatus]
MCYSLGVAFNTLPIVYILQRVWLVYGTAHFHFSAFLASSPMTDSLRLIILLGQVGVGKSSFINTLTGLEVMHVNHWHPYASQYDNAVRPFAWKQSLEYHHVVLVDTPGFNSDDDYYKPLDQLVQWVDDL